MLERVDPELRPYVRDLLDWLYDDWAYCGVLDGMAQQSGLEPSEARDLGLSVLAVGFENGWFIPGELRSRLVQSHTSTFATSGHRAPCGRWAASCSAAWHGQR